MKATGKQWNEFLASWPDGWWYDDADVTVNGVDENDLPADYYGDIKPTDRVEVTCGVIEVGNRETKDLVREFRKWIKAQNYELVMVEVPRTVDAHHFESRIRELFGAKVVKA